MLAAQEAVRGWLRDAALVLEGVSVIPSQVHQPIQKFSHVHVNDDTSAYEAGQTRMRIDKDTFAYQYGAWTSKPHSVKSPRPA